MTTATRACMDCGAQLDSGLRSCPVCGALLVRRRAGHQASPDITIFVMSVMAAMALLLALMQGH